MKPKLLLLLLLLIPIANAYNIDISINSNDIVKEDFTIDLNDSAQYDNFEYLTVSKPLNVLYDDDFTIEKGADNYKLSLKNNGKNPLRFSLLFNNILEKSDEKRMLRVSFENADEISVTLPEGYVLSDKPNTIPEPDEISSDGRHIRLDWSNTDSVAVFYQGQRSYTIFIVLGFLLLIILGVLFFFSKRRISKAVQDILSDDERSIIGEVKKGVTKQKEIAINLNFSKSKMSKVMRKLEEKELIEKIPHFKTNIIKLKKI